MLKTSERFLYEVETKMLARKTLLTVLSFLTAYCLLSLGTSQLLAGQPAESEVDSGPVDQFAKAKSDLELVNFAAMRLAVKDLMKNFPEKYTDGEKYLVSIDIY